MNLRKIDKTTKLVQQFQDELNTFSDFLVKTKHIFLKIFSEENEIVLENVMDMK